MMYFNHNFLTNILVGKFKCILLVFFKSIMDLINARKTENIKISKNYFRTNEESSENNRS
jgi:hypothetical protein